MAAQEGLSGVRVGLAAQVLQAWPWRGGSRALPPVRRATLNSGGSRKTSQKAEALHWVGWLPEGLGPLELVALCGDVGSALPPGGPSARLACPPPTPQVSTRQCVHRGRSACTGPVGHVHGASQSAGPLCPQRVLAQPRLSEQLT